MIIIIYAPLKTQIFDSNLVHYTIADMYLYNIIIHKGGICNCWSLQCIFRVLWYLLAITSLVCVDRLAIVLCGGTTVYRTTALGMCLHLLIIMQSGLHCVRLRNGLKNGCTRILAHIHTHAHTHKPCPNVSIIQRFRCIIHGPTLYSVLLYNTQVQALMQYTVGSHGRIDYLVNNGGGQFHSPLADVSTKGWNAVIDTNLNGTFYCLKHGEMGWRCDNILCFFACYS